jgi:hypothetical protein
LLTATIAVAVVAIVVVVIAVEVVVVTFLVSSRIICAIYRSIPTLLEISVVVRLSMELIVRNPAFVNESLIPLVLESFLSCLVLFEI